MHCSSGVLTRSGREIYERINAMLDNKLDLTTLASDQDTSDRKLEGNGTDLLQQPSSMKGKSGVLVPGNRQRSVSFSTPEVKSSIGRLGGVCSVFGEASLAAESPLRGRPHASEAGSPTLEQALMIGRSSPMGRSSPGSDAGYGSGYQSETHELMAQREVGRKSSSCSTRHEINSEEEDDDDDYEEDEDKVTITGEKRPTLREIEELDRAVTMATYNLQKLQEKQAALRGNSATATQSIPQDRLERGILNSLPSMMNSSSSINSRDSLYDLLNQEPDIRDTFERASGRDPLALERAARQYRSAAAVHDANCTWSGQLPPRIVSGRQPSYSSKVFLGGVPWDITETSLLQAFAEFGPVRVEWPGRDSTSPPRGYLYLVLEDEERVKDLLVNCIDDFKGGNYYFKISSRKMRSKEIQVIPWLISDSTYARYTSPRLDTQRTVFVGALHGFINAQSLALIFNDLFGGVIFAGLDTDKYKYPIGSGRVTFNNPKSYEKAVLAAFIEIKTPKFSKKVQVDPWLEDALCSVCKIKQGPYFCRDIGCFNYFCRVCWEQQHANTFPQHKLLMRNIRGLTRARMQDSSTLSDELYAASSRDSKLITEFWNSPAQAQIHGSDSANWRSSGAAATPAGGQQLMWRNCGLDAAAAAWGSVSSVSGGARQSDGLGWPDPVGSPRAGGGQQACDSHHQQLLGRRTAVDNSFLAAMLGSGANEAALSRFVAGQLEEELVDRSNLVVRSAAGIDRRSSEPPYQLQQRLAALGAGCAGETAASYRRLGGSYARETLAREYTRPILGTGFGGYMLGREESVPEQEAEGGGGTSELERLTRHLAIHM